MIDAAIVRPGAPGLVGQMRHLVAGGRMDHRRIGRQFRRRPGLAVSGDRAIDQFRIELAAARRSRASTAASRRGENSPPARRRSRPAGGRPRAPSGDFRSSTRLFLPTLSWPKAVEQLLRTGGRVRIVSPSLGLDLDDLRAHVGEHPRAMRPGNRGRKIEHAQAREAACQIPLIVTGYGHSCKTPSAFRLSFSACGVTLNCAATAGKAPAWGTDCREPRIIAGQTGPFLASALIKAGTRAFL